jgi:hypothetical protein
MLFFYFRLLRHDLRLHPGITCAANASCKIRTLVLSVTCVLSKFQPIFDPAKSISYTVARVHMEVSSGDKVTSQPTTFEDEKILKPRQTLSLSSNHSHSVDRSWMEYIMGLADRIPWAAYGTSPAPAPSFL